MITYDKYILRITIYCLSEQVTQLYLDAVTKTMPRKDWCEDRYLGFDIVYDTIEELFNDWLDRIHKEKCEYEETKQLFTDMFNDEI